MRTFLLAATVLCSLAAVVMNASIVSRGLVVAGFIVVAAGFVLLAGRHIRRVNAVKNQRACDHSMARIPIGAAAGGSPHLSTTAHLRSYESGRRVA